MLALLRLLLSKIRLGSLLDYLCDLLLGLLLIALTIFRCNLSSGFMFFLYLAIASFVWNADVVHVHVVVCLAGASVEERCLYACWHTDICDVHVDIYCILRPRCRRNWCLGSEFGCLFCAIHLELSLIPSSRLWFTFWLELLLGTSAIKAEPVLVSVTLSDWIWYSLSLTHVTGLTSHHTWAHHSVEILLRIHITHIAQHLHPSHIAECIFGFRILHGLFDLMLTIILLHADISDHLSHLVIDTIRITIHSHHRLVLLSLSRCWRWSHEVVPVDSVMSRGDPFLDILLAPLVFDVVGQRWISLLRSSWEPWLSCTTACKLELLVLNHMLLLLSKSAWLGLVVYLERHLMIQSESSMCFILVVFRLGSLLNHVHLLLVFHYRWLIKFSLLMLKSHVLRVCKLSSGMMSLSLKKTWFIAIICWIWMHG